MHEARRKQRLWTQGWIYLQLPRAASAAQAFSPFPTHITLSTPNRHSLKKGLLVLFGKHPTQHKLCCRQASPLYKKQHECLASCLGIHFICEIQSKGPNLLRRLRVPRKQWSHIAAPYRSERSWIPQERSVFPSVSSFTWHCQSQRAKGSFTLTWQGTNHKPLDDVSTIPRARRTVCGNEKLWVDESVSNQATRTAIKYSNNCDFCHQLPSFLLVKAN